MRKHIHWMLLALCGLTVQTLMGQTLQEARIYFDSPSNGYQNLNFPSANSIDQAFDVNVSGLSNGVHMLYIEVKNNEGVWSLYDKDLVQIIGNSTIVTLNAVEYFFNEDPGFGEGTQIAVSDAAIDGQFSVDVSGLPNGIHNLYIRVRDNSGLWSLYDKKLIQVVGSSMQEIVEAEYYFDTDPGFGNANSIDLNNVSFPAALEVSAAGIATGVHRLYIRVKDNSGIWSLYSALTVTVTNNTGVFNLVAAEYYFDNDPGIGNGIALLVEEGNVINETFEINLPANLTGSHTICVRVQSETGEWSAVACQTFNVCAIAAPSISVIGNNCQNTPYILSLPANTYDNIVWSTGEQSSSIEITQPGNYEVTVTDNGCSVTSSVTTNFQLTTPITFVESGNSCEGDPQTITVADVFDTYTWSSGSTSNTTTVTASGIYTLVATQGSCVVQEAYNLQLIQLPTPTITANGNVLTCNQTGYSYQWFFNGIAIANANGQTFNPLVAGVYSVEISNGTGANACSATSANFNFTPVGVDEIMESNVQLYPNPATHAVHIVSTTVIGPVKLINAIGQVLMEFNVTTNQFTIDLQRFEAGVYFVQCHSSNHRFVKQ